MTALEVLLVEDNPTDAELIGMELENWPGGLDLQWAPSRDALQQRLDEGAPALVLCDSQLPGLHCSEVIEQVRARWPAVPFVVCSGSLEGEELAAVIALADGALDKNRLDSLCAVMRSALNSKQALPR